MNSTSSARRHSICRRYIRYRRSNKRVRWIPTTWLQSTINNTKLNFKKLNVSEINRFLYENRITIPYKFFLERSKESFDLLDSINHENIHRVYPHEIFCNKKFKGECITHDSNKIFYADMNHPTADAAKLINDLIIKKINQIEKKSIYSLNVHLK